MPARRGEVEQIGLDDVVLVEDHIGWCKQQTSAVLPLVLATAAESAVAAQPDADLSVTGPRVPRRRTARTDARRRASAADRRRTRGQSSCAPS